MVVGDGAEELEGIPVALAITPLAFLAGSVFSFSSNEAAFSSSDKGRSAFVSFKRKPPPVRLAEYGEWAFMRGVMMG